MYNTKNLLEYTNKKWFINLSITVIPQDVYTLLQFGDKFCLPILNKKTAIHEFIRTSKAVPYIKKLTTRSQSAILQFTNSTSF